MNFLAHYVVATRHRGVPPPLPAYVLGNALPDLLPLAGTHRRFRSAVLETSPLTAPEGTALREGVLAHLATDAVFHRTATFAETQTGIKVLLHAGGFEGMRLRPFFLAHVLTELALDAALLRREPGLADAFYADFTAADFAQSVRWAEATLQAGLPELPGVLSRFALSRYLESYLDDSGVAEGLSRLCARARQDTFRGENFVRLTAVAAAAVDLLDACAPALLAETAAALPSIPPP